MNNNLNTLLVDASYLFKRSCFGAKNLYSKGKPIGGLYQFIMTLRKLIGETKANKVVLAWDGENSGKLRYYIYEGYKANRDNKSWHKKITLTEKEIAKEEREKSELWQRVRIQQYAEELFIRQIECDEVEGDDVIAYYCKHKPDDEVITIFTNDRDYFQLMDYKDVSIYVDNKNQIINKHLFFMYFDYHYSNALTMKILCGDSSDNVDGVKGLGETVLLKHFPEMKERRVTVNEVMKRAKQINKERLANKLKPLKVLEEIGNSKELFIRNKKLMDLSEPLMTREAEEVFEELYDPLSSEDRGSANLLPMVTEDGIMDIYQGTFPNLVSPFYPVIMREKEYFTKYKTERELEEIHYYKQFIYHLKLIMENQVGNQYKFGLYIKNRQGELTTITERIFDGNEYATKGPVDIRKILNPIQKKIQSVFSSTEVLDFDFGPYSLLKDYKKSNKLNKGAFEDILYTPAKKSVVIKENKFTGVEMLFGLYHNDSPVFTRFLYLYDYRPEARLSVNLYEAVNDIVEDIKDKILRDEKKQLWDDYQIMEKKGFYHISQVRELSDIDRRRILSTI